MTYRTTGPPTRLKDYRTTQYGDQDSETRATRGQWQSGLGAGHMAMSLATESDHHPGPWWANGPSIISLRETLSGSLQGNTLGARAVAQGSPGP